MAISTSGAISYVTYRNLQIQTAREIEATEKRIASLVQDDIPSIHAEIDRHLARYDLREKLQRNGSKLISTPANCMELIPTKPPSISLQSHRP
ncbi:MAG: hypothetical protein RI957_1509 [Verrucomicrobiota bacterium]